MKTIAISNTINGVKTVVETNATTLGELKQFMNDNNISYPSDALWYSGLTKSRLEFDSSEFLSENPRTCNINGEEKNVYAVVLIVPSKNKIDSGMTRGEAYEYICDNNLKEDVYEEFGKNFTNVSTNDLIEFIEYHKTEESEEDNECDNCCCHNSAPSPLEALKFINSALTSIIDVIEERDSKLEDTKELDDLDKMLKELR